MTYKAGDIVRLKSGTFPMVVGATSSDGRFVKCYWQNVTSAGVEPRDFPYPAEVLDLVEPPSDPASSLAPPSSMEGVAEPADAPSPSGAIEFAAASAEPDLPEPFLAESAFAEPVEPEPSPPPPSRRPSWLGSRS